VASYELVTYVDS